MQFHQLREAVKKKKNGLTIQSLSTFVKESLINEAPFLGATLRPFPKDQLQDYLRATKDKTKGPKDKYEKPYIHASNIEVKDEQNKEYDTDKLKALITQRPTSILKQNEKMVHSDGTSTVYFNIGLPALKGLAVNETTGEFVIVDTCPGAGVCKTFCYAMKGGYVQWKAASLSTTRVLNFLLNDPEGFRHLVTMELKNAEKKFGAKGTKVVVRWHDAGDFFSPEYLDVAYKIARDFPAVDFYAYTKIASVAQSNKPSNFKINFSSGAQPSQEKMVDFARTKHSRVVPKEMFQDLIQKQGTSLVRDAKGRMQFKDHAALEEFKHRLSNKYAVPMHEIITYDQLLHTPVGTVPKWYVIVLPGDGDTAANRHDVIGSYLVFH